jgi:multidrug efflux pump subunit AcrA (membrane-fusion protein)
MTVKHFAPGVALSLLALGCTPDQPAKTQTGDATPKVALVNPTTLRRVIEQPGQIEAYEETPLVARIPGQLDRVLVDAGDDITGPKYDDKDVLVKPGQVLATLYVPDMVKEHAQKQAQITQAKADLRQAEALVKTAEAQVATAFALVKEAEAGRVRAQSTYEFRASELQRFEKMAKEKTINEQARDEVRNQLKAADAGRQEQEAKIASTQAMAKESEAKEVKARADLEAAKARVEVAQADEQRVAALLSFAEIRAPYDGVVVRRYVHTGHFVQPGTTAGSPLFLVSRTDKLRLVVDIPESDALIITDNTPAQVQVMAIPGKTFTGKVNLNSWSLDKKTHTLHVEIELENPKAENAKRPLRPGMYAIVTLTKEVPGRWMLPASAVGGQGNQTFGFIVEGNKVRRVALKTGLRDAKNVEVMQYRRSPDEKAKGGDWVNVAGDTEFVRDLVPGLSDGQQVRVQGAKE